ncbi:MAG: glycosyltransferase family 2 protein [Proteobacteria bacterium]|nr:glycosyltransferase family 2 protein [Pseudomonadota bacterium]MBU1686340.1 glycosyltransferase family 2 protein [Pseudomonadota bacterium]
MPDSNRNVIAIVVTYNPDLSTLQQQLVTLAPQVSAIVMVDNASQDDLVSWLKTIPQTVDKLIRLGDNYGVGAAQNHGIEWARRCGSAFVLLMDQDSIPQTGMVEELLLGYQRLTGNGAKVAAVGTQYQDDQEAPLSGFVRFSSWFGRNIVHCATGDAELECDFLIASGSLIPMTAISEVGTMDEELFIDHVDTEWCLRARAKGYRLFGICSAVMLHELGLHRVKAWWLGGREVAIRPPFRYYYMIRNSILLLRRSYPCRSWRFFEIRRLILSCVFFGIFLPGRGERLKMMFKGGRDGLGKMSGKL